LVKKPSKTVNSQPKKACYAPNKGVLALSDAFKKFLKVK